MSEQVAIEMAESTFEALLVAAKAATPAEPFEFDMKIDLDGDASSYTLRSADDLEQHRTSVLQFFTESYTALIHHLRAYGFGVVRLS